MRSHRLTNATGETYNLTGKDVIFHQTEGYGFEAENTFYRIGNRFIPIEKKNRQSSVTGKIIFYGEAPYVQYYDFARFVGNDNLVLEYTTDAGIFYKNVVVGKLSKGEINKFECLECDIEFVSLTPWYKKVNITIKPNQDVEHLSTFPWSWPVHWSSENGMQIVVDSDSDIPSPCRLIISGPIENPQWRHYTDGVYQSRGLIQWDVQKGESLVIDTLTDPYGIYLRTKDGGTQDLYQLSDFDMERFILLKKGHNVITVESRFVSDKKTTVKLEGQIYYDTV